MPEISPHQRPQIPDAFARQRLLVCIDSILEGERALWVAAPAGSGKTTLLSNYVDHSGRPCLWYQIEAMDRDPAHLLGQLGVLAKDLLGRRRRLPRILLAEYATDPRAFALHFFRALFCKLPEQTLLVFDEMQLLDGEASASPWVQAAIEARPPKVGLCFLSRSAPAAKLALLQGRRLLSQLGWADLRLTPDEARGVLNALGRPARSEHQIQQLYQMSDGWVTGLVLLSHQQGDDRLSSDLHGGDTPRLLFDYVGAEFFASLGENPQTLLSAICLCPTVTATSAQRLSGLRGAGALLEDLHQRGLLVARLPGKPPSYRLHPLLAAYLRARQEDLLDEHQLQELRRQSAACLERQGDVLAAAELLRQDPDPSGLENWLRAHAETLVKKEQLKTLRGLIETLPEATILTDGRLSYWLGVCLLASDARQARALFERAFALLDTAGERRGVFLAWARVVESIVFESRDYTPLDDWLNVLERIKKKHGLPLSPEVFARVHISQFNAYVHRRSDVAGFANVERMLRGLMRVAPDVNARFMLGAHLVRYYNWVGNIPAASAILRRLQPALDSSDLAPFTRLVWLAMSSVNAWLTEGAEPGRAAAEQGLALGQETGIHVLDFYFLAQGAYSGLVAGRFDWVEHYVERLGKSLRAEHQIDLGHYLYFCAWIELERDQPRRALELMQQCLDIGRCCGSPYITARAHHGLAQALQRCGDLPGASAQLDATEALARPSGFLPLLYLSALCRSELHEQAGDTEASLRCLTEAFTLGQSHAYHYVPHWSHAALAQLCARALTHGIQPDYARTLIQRHRLSPPGDMNAQVPWPWAVEIQALGSFALWVDGRRVNTDGAPRPLSLLKVLVALGGQQIPASQVSEILWPESDGDAAAGALKTTISRLRRLIGARVLQWRDGALSLNPGQVGVDVQRVEPLLDQALSDDPPESPQIPGWVQAYTGHLLPEIDAGWVRPLRLRLADKYRRAVDRWAQIWIERGQVEQALELYACGLDRDGQAEQFYAGQMRALLQLGRERQALHVYQRCCQAIEESQLSSTLIRLRGQAQQALHGSHLNSA